MEGFTTNDVLGLDNGCSTYGASYLDYSCLEVTCGFNSATWKTGWIAKLVGSYNLVATRLTIDSITYGPMNGAANLCLATNVAGRFSVDNQTFIPAV